MSTSTRDANDANEITNPRALARSRGLRLAARVATIGGIAVAALGLVEARAAATTASDMKAAASDDARVLPFESAVKVAQSSGGGCGCTPCWGPPAPPAKSERGVC